ncbi:MAG: ABC transporter ATP-binding protein [Dehalococcoidia bacterium]|nr:Glutamine transport ATP-binding protein GlnQ [Chloroflexota bacterium]MBT9162054.1 Glutamine transport ATP-binding protein GlnQ [Chloroflexota bacterium]
MIEFKGVSKSFNGRRVLTDLSFRITEDQIMGIIGPSGAGKTTILRLITGALRPDAGEVLVGSGKIGYVFQDPRLLLWRTAADNIGLAMRAQGVSKEEARRKARTWMERLGLQGFEDHYPNQLSGGMMQRVSIGRALAIEPKILLLDEPFSNLDVELKDALLSITERLLGDYRVTVVHVTHDLIEALRLDNRICRLVAGGRLEDLPLHDREGMMCNFIAKRIHDNKRSNKDAMGNMHLCV